MTPSWAQGPPEQPAGLSGVGASTKGRLQGLQEGRRLSAGGLSMEISSCGRSGMRVGRGSWDSADAASCPGVDIECRRLPNPI